MRLLIEALSVILSWIFYFYFLIIVNTFFGVNFNISFTTGILSYFILGILFGLFVGLIIGKSRALILALLPMVLLLGYFSFLTVAGKNAGDAKPEGFIIAFLLAAIGALIGSFLGIVIRRYMSK